jgi:hypothetical protein
MKNLNGWGYDSVVEYLLSICEALGSIPNTLKTKQKQTKSSMNEHH